MLFSNGLPFRTRKGTLPDGKTEILFVPQPVHESVKTFGSFVRHEQFVSFMRALLDVVEKQNQISGKFKRVYS